MSTESQGSPPSHSSAPCQCRAWWREPERLVAVTGACLLHWVGKLGPWETTVILSAALGTDVLRAATLLLQRPSRGSEK